MSTKMSGAQLAALGRAVLRRVEVVPQPLGGYILQPNAEEADHGEGGEPLPPPQQPLANDDGGVGADTIEDTPEAQLAATRLQSIQRGRLARARVESIRAEKSAGDPQ